MKKGNIKSTTLSKTLKSLVFALGLGLSVNSCSSCSETNIQDDSRIEFEDNENNHDLENIEPSISDNDLENIDPSISNNDIKNPEVNNQTNENNSINTNKESDDHNHDHEHEHSHKYKDWQYYDSDNEISICEDCSEVKYRKHNFNDNYQVTYESNNNGTHKITEVKDCNSCDYSFENKYDAQCNLGSWVYNKTTGLEERQCNVCGYKETRIHEHQTPANLEYKLDQTNGNGTHKLKATYNCSVCGKEMTLYKDAQCNLGSWVYNNTTGLEERKCNVCGYKETKHHEHQTPANLEYKLYKTNADGTHKLKVTYNCTVCNGQVVLYKDESCDYTSWSNSGAVSCVRECKICGYDEIKKHNFTVVPNSVTSNATVGLHDVLEKCSDCNYEKKVTVSCTSDGNKYFYQQGNIITERENCAICGDVCIKDPHNHTYGNYISVDDGVHKRTCACGNESVEAHNYDSWVVTSDGTNSRTCSSCNHTETVTHTCSLKDHVESSATADCCYVIVTTCEIDGCPYESRVQVGHNFQVESNMFGSIYTCYDCGYSYEQPTATNSLSLYETENEESNNKQLILK